MLIHKEIIIRLVITFIIFAIALRIMGPVFMDYLKKKLPGGNADSDIDQMIRRQKERLRAQYGLTGDIYTNQKEVNSVNKTEEVDHTPPTKEIKKIFHETQWGGGAFVKEIQQEIAKTYSYTMAETKINAFLLLCEKRNYIRNLSPENKNNISAIKNYLVTLLLLLLMVEELREKNFFIIERVSKKLSITAEEFALSLQIKILMTASLKKELKEERIFTEVLVISQYSEETIKDATEFIAKKEANLWAKSPSQLFEELTLALNFANMITPIPKLKNRKDIETAHVILGTNKDLNLDEIKKAYKKLAISKHPDKIISQKLPKVLERKAFERFNKIQEAYEVIMENKK